MSESGHQHGRRRAAILAVLVALQAVAAVFFIADVIADIHWIGLDPHTALEAAVTVALVIGVVFGAREMRRTLERNRRAEAAIAAASGALGELMRTAFEDWHLTPGEADVALLVIKGFDTAEIAELRGSAAGTVRAHLTRVYAKAGVSSRAQLVSFFIDELLEKPVLPETAGA